MRIGMTGQRIHENDEGQWRNVRLNLTYECEYEFETSYYQIEHPRYRYGSYGWDHLVYQNLDDTTDTGRAISARSIDELSPDSEPGIGTVLYNEVLLECIATDSTPEGFCDTARVEISYLVYATIELTLPPCGNWRIWYVLDHMSWNMFCGINNDPRYGVYDTRCVMRRAPAWGSRCAGIDTNLVWHIQNNSFDYTFIDVDMGECEEFPPTEDEVKTAFTGYIKPDGSDGRNWLPTPGDSIGLVFEFQTDPPGQQFNLVYHIWDMTMWQGECMNSPRFDDFTQIRHRDIAPHTTGFAGQVPWDSLEKFRFWDFTVGDPESYGYYVRDTVTYLATAPGNYWRLPGDTLLIEPQPQYPLQEGRPLFRTEIIAYATTDQEVDTLWLKARDYAAHCIVTPEVGGGKDRRMRMWHPDSAYVLDSLWSITVPFDYDGNNDVGVNYGDYMADAWEYEFAKQWQDSEWVTQDIVYFRPFVTPFHGISDSDLVVKGRGIEGDNFCNFAEYRGLMIADDSTKTSAGHSHRRLHPVRKSLIIHVRNNMDEDLENQSVLDLMPGYIYQLQIDTSSFTDTTRIDTLEILFTDSIRFLPVKYSVNDQSAIEAVRFDSVYRDINYNRAGAGLWYFGFGEPTTFPMSALDTIRAATFWYWDEGRELAFLSTQNVNPAGNLGYTVFFHPAFQSGQERSLVPNLDRRTVVNIWNYRRIHQSYYVSDSLWNEDFSRMCKRTIAHEIGHAVGMFHTPINTTERTIMTPWRLNPITNHFEIQDSVFADTSKAEISIRER